MTRIKFCGLTHPEDIAAANDLRPDYIGFVFWPKSRRYISPEDAAGLKKLLDPGILATGVFVDEEPDVIAALAARGIIDIAQLHGSEDESYLQRLRQLTPGLPIIQAFRIRTEADVIRTEADVIRAEADVIRAEADVIRAEASSADLLLLDSGAGTGRTFDWTAIRRIRRPYLLAGGLTPENAGEAVRTLHPYGLDTSSGIETEGRKDPRKMVAFMQAVRQADDH